MARAAPLNGRTLGTRNEQQAVWPPTRCTRGQAFVKGTASAPCRVLLLCLSQSALFAALHNRRTRERAPIYTLLWLHVRVSAPAFHTQHEFKR
jgi:hypothetical protein